MVSYDWYDDIRYDIFDAVGIDAPPESIYFQKSDWRFVSPNKQNSFDIPQAKAMEEISVSRRKLIGFLASLALSAGCRIHYGTEVKNLITENSKVVGIVTESGNLHFDLVIDACGLNSPFRAEIPTEFGIQPKIESSGVMRGYRAFCNRASGSATPSPAASLYVKHCDSVGISWCNLNQLNEVDVLIGRIGKLDENEKNAALEDLCLDNDIFDLGIPNSELWVDIGVRCPIAMFVADGYAAVGDSAFMSMPLMGSGIESSMKAGKWLAETLIGNKVTEFSAANLWAYELKFFERLGRDYVFIDVIKRWALKLPSAELNWLFGCGVVTDEDMKLVSTDSDVKVKLGVGAILHKLNLLLSRKGFMPQAVKWLLRAARAKAIAKRIPKKYNLEKIKKWQRQYNLIIDKTEQKA